MDVNGSLRSIVMAHDPARYFGVDEICSSEKLNDRFGERAFDLVPSTEMLEHVADWRTAIYNLKAIVKPNGVLLVTTRSKGYPLHGFPSDCWCFELEDCAAIFADFDIDALVSDGSGGPGVFLCARKPGNYQPADLSGYAIHSVSMNERSAALRYPLHNRASLYLKLWLLTWIVYPSLIWGLRIARALSRHLPQRIRAALKRRVVR